MQVNGSADSGFREARRASLPLAGLAEPEAFPQIAPCTARRSVYRSVPRTDLPFTSFTEPEPPRSRFARSRMEETHAFLR
jgi:hypothetical protein